MRQSNRMSSVQCCTADCAASSQLLSDSARFDDLQHRHDQTSIGGRRVFIITDAWSHVLTRVNSHQKRDCMTLRTLSGSTTPRGRLDHGEVLMCLFEEKHLQARARSCQFWQKLQRRLHPTVATE